MLLWTQKNFGDLCKNSDDPESNGELPYDGLPGTWAFGLGLSLVNIVVFVESRLVFEIKEIRRLYWYESRDL